MDRYFIDTEFIEGPQKTFFGYTKPTIDLISIGIKCDDGREYYSISKDFNLKEAWNRYDMKQESCPITGVKTGRLVKEYWLRQNVLYPIWVELEIKYLRENHTILWMMNPNTDWSALVKPEYFNFKRLEGLIKEFGKSNKEIAEEVEKFCTSGIGEKTIIGNTIEFYAYYGDYDWVVFCWLFGKMINLPCRFPKYCKDLQQIFDEKKSLVKERMKDQPRFPVNKGIHNALEDAKWNFELFKFLNTI